MYHIVYHILILTDRNINGSALPWVPSVKGITYDVATGLEAIRSVNGNQAVKPDAVLLDLDSLRGEKARDMASSSHELGLPVVAVVSERNLVDYNPSLNLDDFILQPLRSEELLVRVSQAIFRIRGPQDREVIKVGDLLIDLERYEVSLAGNKVFLTYKEYQLLVLLASNPGKVYTRENLLSQVWRYDYLGGTRTVDVHVRRLRSKIEDASHSFIETIWNVGYRFKAGT